MMPEQFVDLVRSLNSQESPFALATIPGSYTSGQPTLIFDGETTATTRQYPRLASYTPAANDRVLVALVGHGAVILGKVV